MDFFFSKETLEETLNFTVCVFLTGLRSRLITYGNVTLFTHSIDKGYVCKTA